ncbi:MAG: VOC family protein [Actinomycetota bacterium]|nr:VOC family protein [Actinomycetota bacterium]
MTSDPFPQLRLTDRPVSPDHRFAARLRVRLGNALSDPSTDRSTFMTTDTSTTSTITSLVPYLCVDGAADAINWYSDVFGAVETLRYTGNDGRIGHAELSIGPASLMLADEYPEIGVRSPRSLGGTPVTLHLMVPDVDEVFAKAVAAGANATGEPQDQEYGARSVTLDDPFGHRWMVQTPTGSPTWDEVQAKTENFTITQGAPEDASEAE